MGSGGALGAGGFIMRSLRRSKLHHEGAWANLGLARANQRGVLFVYLLASGLFGVATFSVGLAVAG
ncbi:MAG: hypothetical protein V3T64_06855 [Myxococcota bacterium]